MDGLSLFATEYADFLSSANTAALKLCAVRLVSFIVSHDETSY
jgi:hypothetical protein